MNAYTVVLYEVAYVWIQTKLILSLGAAFTGTAGLSAAPLLS